MFTTTMSRRALLGAGLAGAVGLTAACRSPQFGDAEHVLVGGHQLAVGTPFDAGMMRFAELVEQMTDGRVLVDVHPNAALGTEPEMFQGLVTGTMDVGIFAPGSIAEFMPEMSMLSMPFLVTDRGQRDAVLEGDVTERLADRLRERTGTYPLTYFGGSYRQMFFNAPATSLEDVQGRLFRTQPAAVLTDCFAAVGLRPTVVAYNELYNALAQGVVDGADNEAVFIDSQKFFEPAPHILRTNHEVTIRPLLIADTTLADLGSELADLVIEAGAEAGRYQRDLEEGEDDAMIAELAEREGLTVTDADTSAVLDDVHEIWDRYAQQWDAQDLLADIIDLRPEG
ncbi:TRAP transporter substrate-binding protein [Pseudactinotalea sp.]|uniref:TRAP transporter substrate-binding protein n=1 Tax=Pseudactinotalea sp. TaxID=1926260 RepID=UPI003B3AC49D